MGSTVCRAVLDAPGLELVAAVDPLHAGIDLGQLGVHGTQIQVAPSATALLDAGAQVAVDFTVIDAARENLVWCAEQRRARGRRHHRVQRRRARRLRRAVRALDGQRGDRAELRDRRGLDDALRRDRGAVLRDRARSSSSTTTRRSTRRRARRCSPRNASPPRRRTGATTRRPRWSPTGARGGLVERHPGALGPPARDGRAPGGAARHDRPEPVDPPRHLRPVVVHARRAARGAEGRRTSPGLTIGLDALLGL